MGKLITLDEKTYELLEIIKNARKGKNFSFNTLIAELIEKHIDASQKEAFYEHIREKKIFRAISELQLWNYIPQSLEKHERDAAIALLQQEKMRAFTILYNNDREFARSVRKLIAHDGKLVNAIIKHERKIENALQEVLDEEIEV